MKNVIVKIDKVVRMGDKVKEGFLCGSKSENQKNSDDNINTLFDVIHIYNSS